jgi:hypothetical protein
MVRFHNKGTCDEESSTIKIKLLEVKCYEHLRIMHPLCLLSLSSLVLGSEQRADSILSRTTIAMPWLFSTTSCHGARVHDSRRREKGSQDRSSHDDLLDYYYNWTLIIVVWRADAVVLFQLRFG